MKMHKKKIKRAKSGISLKYGNKHELYINESQKSFVQILLQRKWKENENQLINILWNAQKELKDQMENLIKIKFLNLFTFGGMMNILNLNEG